MGCKKAAEVGLEETWAASLVEGCKAAGMVAKGLVAKCYRMLATMEAAEKIVRADAKAQDGRA